MKTFESFSVSTHILDLVFALDGSDSLTTDEFGKLKEFVMKSLSSYNISRENTHVGVIEYSDEVSIKLPLHQYFTIKELREAIKNIVPSRGRNAVTDEAFKIAIEDVFSITSGGRPGAAKILVLITDDPSTMTADDAASEIVEPLKKTGIQVHVVAIGNRIPPEVLKNITFSDEHVHVVPTPEELPGKTDDVVDVIDEAVQNRK